MHATPAKPSRPDDDETDRMSASESCSQTNTPGSPTDHCSTGATASAAPLLIVKPSVATTMHFNALAAPFVPATAALGPPRAPPPQGHHASPILSTSPERPLDAPPVVPLRVLPVRRWYCQLLGPVFLKPLDEEQWKEELERMAQVNVSKVAVNPTDGLRACVTLSSTSESLALYNGCNMNSRNGTWTLIAERLVPMIFTDGAPSTASVPWDELPATLQQLSSIVGCDVFAHVATEEDDGSYLATCAERLVVDVREGDAAYAAEWDRFLSRTAQGGLAASGDGVRVERATRPPIQPSGS
jgi:hypothetical protein